VGIEETLAFKDENAFIFYLNEKKKFIVKDTSTESRFISSGVNIDWGLGPDFRVCNNAMTSYGSMFRIGTTFISE
jgi:hypothetical protein